MWKKLMRELNLSDSYISMGLGLLVVLVIGVLLFNYFSGKGKPFITETGEQITEEGALEEVSLPTTHTIGEGETLWSIAEKYYKSGYNWVDLAKENNLSDPNIITVGQQITIPKAEPILVRAETQEKVSIPETYTVKEGDCLWDIAVLIYQDGYRWVDIARANNLVNPDIIHPGNVLTLPK